MDTQNPNDFGQPLPTPPIQSKQVVEFRNSISIAKLRKTTAYAERNLVRCNFQLGKVKLCFKKDLVACDWYLELVEPGPKNRCTAISLERTKCNLGGYREWLVCPSCFKRAGILYQEADDFACRKCLFLGYSSQKMNYRTLEPIMRDMKKLEQMDHRIRWQTYKGKPTKRAIRYEKLRAKVGTGFDVYGPRYIGQ